MMIEIDNQGTMTTDAMSYEEAMSDEEAKAIEEKKYILDKLCKCPRCLRSGWDGRKHGTRCCLAKGTDYATEPSVAHGTDPRISCKPVLRCSHDCEVRGYYVFGIPMSLGSGIRHYHYSDAFSKQRVDDELELLATEHPGYKIEGLYLPNFVMKYWYNCPFYLFQKVFDLGFWYDIDENLVKRVAAYMKINKADPSVELMWLKKRYQEPKLAKDRIFIIHVRDVSLAIHGGPSTTGFHIVDDGGDGNAVAMSVDDNDNEIPQTNDDNAVLQSDVVVNDNTVLESGAVAAADLAVDAVMSEGDEDDEEDDEDDFVVVPSVIGKDDNSE